MKKIAAVSVMVAGLMVIAGMCMAESEAINPVEVKTRRLTAYGTNPVKIGATELTEANVIAIKAGGTLPAVNGAAVTSLGSANLLGNIAGARMTNATFLCVAAGTCTNGQVVTYPAVVTTVGAIQFTQKEAGTNWWYASAVNTTNFTCSGGLVAIPVYYSVFAK